MLGLVYGLVFVDLIFFFVMFSNIVCCGGVIYLIVDLLVCSFDLYLEDEFCSKIGIFLIICIGNVNDVIVVLFMIGYMGNLLVVKLVVNVGVMLSWGSWFIVVFLFCLVFFFIVLLLVYWLMCLEIKYMLDVLDLVCKELV